jgi:hypothetical protein
MVPENVSKFLGRHGIVTSTAVRLQEWCIKPSDPLFVLGTLGKRTVNSAWSALPHSPETRLSFSFGSGLSAFSSRNENKLANSVYFIPGVNIPLGPSVGMQSASPATHSQAATAPVSAPAPAEPAAVWKSVSWEEGSQARDILAAAAERKAATAAVLPANAANENTRDDSRSAAEPLTGVGVDTDVPSEAPADAGEAQNLQFDTASPVEIAKGASGQPFFISYRSQREVARSFAWKSALYIWGGPILTLASLYFFSVYFNWM